MVGFVLVTHGGLGKELLDTSTLILPQSKKNIAFVPIDPDEKTASSTEKIGDSIKTADSGDGVILLTDMFGGTPSNIGITFLEEDQVEVVSGVNLPMLIRAFMQEPCDNLKDAANDIRRIGSESITVASDLLLSKPVGLTRARER